MNDETTAETKCRHDGTLGASVNGTICNQCGANWQQICADRPDLRNPAFDARNLDYLKITRGFANG